MNSELVKLFAVQEDLQKQKEKLESNDSIEIVQLIKLVRNLSTVSHYWYLLQTANNYILDVLQKLINQLAFIIDAIEKTKTYKAIEKQKNVKQNLEIMMEEYRGRKALLEELEMNIRCL